MPSRLIQTALFFAVSATAFLAHKQVWAHPPVSFGLPTESDELESLAEAALDKQVSVNFVYTPLRDFAAEIGRLGGVNCVLEFNRLEQAGIKVDHPVNATLRNVSLRTVLRHALRAIELTYIVDDGVLVIITPVDANYSQRLVTRIYPVRDLVDKFRNADHRERLEFSALTALIANTIEPDSWQEVGGPGSIEGSENAASLVISQRRDLHLRIEGLLTTLRIVKGIQNIPSNNSIPNRATAEMPIGKLSRSLPVRSRSSSTILPTSAAPTSAWQLPQLYSGRQ